MSNSTVNNRNMKRSCEEMSEPTLEVFENSDSSMKRWKSEKREDYLSWEDFFMGVALLASQRSKDPVTQVGACIVNKKNIIVGVGYNSLPRGCSDDEFPWGKNKEYELNEKKLYVCHAELNAIINGCKELDDCRIYVTLFPCNSCAQLIVQSGIKKVIYLNDFKNNKIKTMAAKRILDAAKVECLKFTKNAKNVVLYYA